MMDFEKDLKDDSFKVPREDYDETLQKQEYSSPAEDFPDSAIRSRAAAGASTTPTYQSVSTGVDIETTANHGSQESEVTANSGDSGEPATHLEGTGKHEQPASSVQHDAGGQAEASRSNPLPTWRTGADLGSSSLQNLAIGWMVELLKLPVTIPIGLTNIFHNVPLRYGDPTVRPLPVVKGVSSGLAAGGQQFAFGLYDGVTGLVTHPVDGARAEGPRGFVKGVGIGIGGCVCKPSEGACALVGYPFDGVYTDLGKLSKSVQGLFADSLRTTISRLEGRQEARTAMRRPKAISSFRGPQDCVKKVA